MNAQTFKKYGSVAVRHLEECFSVNSPEEGITIWRVGHERWQAGSQMASHAAVRNRLLYVISGELAATLPAGRTVLKRKGVLYLPQGSRFEVHCLVECELVIVNIESDVESLVGLAQGSSIGVVYNALDHVQIELMLDEFAACVFSERQVVRRIAIVYLKAVLLNLLRVPEFYAWGEDPSRVLYNKALGLIKMHYKGGTTVDEIAAMAGCSRKVLYQVFGQYGDESPARLLRHLRMRTASLLLANTGKSVELVSEEMGYSDVAAFSKAFKREFFQSPACWRRERRKIRSST